MDAVKRLLLLFLVILPLSVSCERRDPEERDNTSVLLYVAGNNTLSYYSYDLIRQLERGYLPEKFTDEDQILLYSHSSGERPVLSKITRRSGGGGIDSTVLCIYDVNTNSASAEQLGRVLRDAHTLCPAKHRGLVLWSHGTGYLPEGYTIKPDTKSFGNDNNDKTSEIEIQEIVEVLPTTYEYIIFDACLMGCIEVAYELKDVCDYVLFSPTEILSQGFPYYMMMDRIFSKDALEKALTDIAAEYYDYYLKKYESSKGSYKPSGGTITLVRTAALKSLADVCRPIFDNHRLEIKSLDPNRVQGYFQYGWAWFYDMGDIIRQVSYPEEYALFERSLNNAVVYKAATPAFMSIKIDIDRYSGLSTYLPDERNVRLNAYYRNLKWNQATGLLQ